MRNNSKDTKRNVRREQPKKDNNKKRINLDNERESKFKKMMDEKEPDTTRVRRGQNDISWYAKNPELLKSAGSIPFASILGDKLYFGGDTPTLPGILQFGWCPEVGGGVEPPIAINQCAASIYSFLVHANSRNYKYDQSDLLMLILAGGSVFTGLANVIRAYGIAKTYWEQNRYTPKSLLHAMGFQPDDFINNLGQVWFDINNLIAQTTQIWIPNTLPIIQRWFWLSSNVFTDANDPKGQLYVFTPMYLFKYEPLLTDQGGGIIRTNIAGSDNVLVPSSYQYSWVQWRDTLQMMIDALIKDQDRGIMYGDILNAYGADKIYAIPPLSSDYRVEPVYNPEVLTQIENLTVSQRGMVGLAQQNNQIIPMRQRVGNNTGWGWNHPLPNSPILNFHQKEQPTPEQIMIATRLQACTTEQGPALDFEYKDGIVTVSTNQAFYPKHAGSETINHIRMYKDADYLNPIVIDQQNFAYDITSLSSEQVQWLFDLAAFDWHPFFYELQEPGEAEREGGEVKQASGDYANYTIMWPTMLRKLHDTALFSEFGVPQI